MRGGTGACTVGYLLAMSFNSERGIMERYQKNYCLINWEGSLVRACEFVEEDFIGATLDSIVLGYDVIELRLTGISARVNGLVILNIPCDGDVSIRGRNGFGSRCSADYLYSCIGGMVTKCCLGEGVVRLSLEEAISSRTVHIEFKWWPLVS